MADPHSSGSDEKQQGSRTETIQVDPENSDPSPPILQLRLNPPKSESKVKWTADTVDNEFMGKKKSKCCCIYEKQKVFGESSTSEEDDDDDHGCTPHCKGHKKKCYRKSPHKHDHEHKHDDDGGGMDPEAGPENGEPGCV